MTRALDPAVPGRPIEEPAETPIPRPERRVPRLLGLASEVSLARRFLVASLAVLVVGGVAIGLWVGSQLQRGIIDRTASITGLYVQSFIEPHLASLADGPSLDGREVGQLDQLLSGTGFGERIVSLKVWRPDGTIVYSSDRSLIGRRFAVEGNLAAAVAGSVTAEMSSLDASENAGERGRFDHLLEMYLPVRERGGDRIIAVAEFYQSPEDIDREVAGAQLRSWAVVVIAVTLAVLLLFGIVRQGSETIVRQERALRGQVAELSALLEQNEQLRERVRMAAERTTTLGERNLRRISSDLHDGPGQMLALAMLRLERLQADPAGAAERDQLRDILSDALRDMRTIAAGLRLPELESLDVGEIVRRAVDDHVRRSGTPVETTLEPGLRDASLPTKIALFRALQELLSNSTRHGRGEVIGLEIVEDRGALRATVTDKGPGFDAGRVGAEGHLGLAGIREQAELLGGTFEVGARADGGARVTVSWPL
jgi:signal transduction histidine kinase